MRSSQQAQVLEICQHRTDRGGRQVERADSSQRLRAHGMPAADISFDNQPEDFARSFAQFGNGRCGHVVYLTDALAASSVLGLTHIACSYKGSLMRPSGRAPDEMRAIAIETGDRKSTRLNSSH